ncbi:MAG: hypothetical protein HFI73_00095 [Bacilli bacterium]|jgi:ABC-type multidrug transport system ATPase subunit|nr:hypothetical protein [Bacilli bacterium]
MEIVFYSKGSDIVKPNLVTGFYGDVLDLLNLGFEIDGIVYDEAWSVSRFLKGHKVFGLDSRIDAIFKYLDIDTSLKNVKLGHLSKTDFKFILLAKVLLLNENNIVFDYFDVGLTSKEQKRLIKIIKMLKKDGKTVVIISNNLVFMSSVIDHVIIINSGSIFYEGNLDDLIKLRDVPDTEIIKFIKLANKSGANLNYTLDSKELLKDIYRSVC